MGIVLCNVLNATSMKNQFAHVRRLLNANGYDTKVTSTISVFDINRKDLDGIIVMTLFDPYFLVASTPALIQYNGKKIIYVTIEGVPKKSSVLYSPLTRLEYITVSKFVAKMLTKAGVRVRASVHHAINVDDTIKALQIAPKVRAKLKSQFPNDVLFLFVGRNDPRKGIDKIVQANNILKQEGLMNYRILVVSDPSIKSVLTDDKFVIVNPFGSMNHVQVLALMRAVDYVMLPSKSEGFGLPVLEAMSVGTPVLHCVPPETLVATIKGWKPICEIKEGDLVLTHKGRFRRVTKVFKRRYRGKLIGIKPRGLNRTIWFTPEHPILTSIMSKKHDAKKKLWYASTEKWHRLCGKNTLAWTMAKDITYNHVLIVPRIKTENVVIDVKKYVKDVKEVDGYVYPIGRNQYGCEYVRPDWHGISAVINPSDEWMRLFGYYISEGCESKGSVQFCLGSKDIAIIEDITKMFDNAKVRKTKENTILVNVYNRPLLDLLKGLFGYGAKNKQIPLWLLQLPEEKLRELLRGLVLGDGCITTAWWGRKRIMYTTVSEKLALSIFMLTAKLGYPLPITWDTKGRRGHILNGSSSYFDWLANDEGRQRKASYCKFDDEYVYLPIREIVEREYDSYVYNLEVEEDNSYVVEGVAVHNCWMPPLTEFSSDEFNFVWEYDTIQLVDTKMSQYFVMHEYDPIYLADSIKDAIDCYVNDHETYEEYRIKALEHAVKWDYRLLYTELLSLEKFNIDKNKAKEDYSRSIEKLSSITDHTINV